MSEPVLHIEDLTLSLGTEENKNYAVDGVSLSLPKGKTYALVGESGCGKSITAHAILRLLPAHHTIYQNSQIQLEARDLLSFSEQKMRQVRACEIGMIFQDPMAALNPVMTIGQQLNEAMKTPSTSELVALLEQVRIPDPTSMLERYPHELSGGMKQRIMIAMALAKKPKVLIADEPTTALDVTTQAQILNLLKELQATQSLTILLITHDLGVVAQMADYVAVMYAGQIIEKASAKRFFEQPSHPYSKKLLSAIPELANHDKQLSTIPGRVPQRLERSKICRFVDRCYCAKPLCHERTIMEFETTDKTFVRCFGYDPNIPKGAKPEVELQEAEQFEEPYDSDFEHPVLTVQDLKVHYPIKKGLFKRTVGHVKAVDGVSLSLSPGETLALVGESGCGKTTTGKAVLQLLSETEGQVVYWGKDLTTISQRQMKKVRGDLQFIFQDPFSAMDPKMRISQILEEGMIALKVGSDPKERQERIDYLMEEVGLSADMKYRYPHEFSGGQRQRLCIARALALSPKLIICDEPTSALDVSVQANILNLLQRLQREFEISYLFITHNIGVVQYLAHEVAVMYLGKVVEKGRCRDVLSNPKHPYTQSLIEAVPKIEVGRGFDHIIRGEVPSNINPPTGCHFHPRCPNAMPQCRQQYPDEQKLKDGRQVRCYLYKEEGVSHE